MAKRNWLAALAVVTMTGSLMAQNPVQPPAGTPNDRPGRSDIDIQAGRNRIQVDVNRKGPVDGNQVAPGQAGMAHRASKVIGMEVRNTAGEEIGKINDLVLDEQTGRVRYAAVSVGGVLGIGDKLFAVPWNAIRVQRTGEETHLVINARADTLKNAPGFNQDAWPNFGDTKWSQTNDDYYSAQGVIETQSRQERRSTPVEGRSP